LVDFLLPSKFKVSYKSVLKLALLFKAEDVSIVIKASAPLLVPSDFIFNNEIALLGSVLLI
jgi:hypothetical protein